MLFFGFCALGDGRERGRDGRERGRDGGREGGGFFLGKTNSLTFLTDLVQFPLDSPQENVPTYLRENIRYLGFPRKTTVFLTFWTDFVPCPTFS